MQMEFHIIKVRAPVYQAAMKLEAEYPDDPPIAVSEWMMDRYERADDREQIRFWRDVWAYFMERDAVADTETFAVVTS